MNMKYIEKIQKEFEEKFPNEIDENFNIKLDFGTYDIEKIKSFISHVLTEQAQEVFLKGYEAGVSKQIIWGYLSEEEKKELLTNYTQ